MTLQYNSNEWFLDPPGEVGCGGHIANLTLCLAICAFESLVFIFPAFKRMKMIKDYSIIIGFFWWKEGKI